MSWESTEDSAVLSQPDERGMVLFKCPGCGYCHGVWTNPANPNEMTGAHWRWNGDRHKPTFEPSILARGEHTCHSYVREGRIQFLNDCTHSLAGFSSSFWTCSEKRYKNKLIRFCR